MLENAVVLDLLYQSIVCIAIVIYGRETDLLEIPSMIYLAKQEIISSWIRNSIYGILKAMVPEFVSIPVSTA